MAMDLKDKNIIVTGASSGIGKALALKLSEAGASVILIARNQNKLVETRKLMQPGSHQIEAFDLLDFDNIPPLLKRIADKHGPLSGLVHCAGYRETTPLRYIKYDNIQKTLGLNLISAIFLTKGFRQKQVAVKGASIVFLASVVGLVGAPGVSCYSASKGGLIAFAKSAALELAAESIRINCLAPAYVASEMLEAQKKEMTEDQFKTLEDAHPLGFGTPEDVADGALFLLSESSKWVTGTVLTADGGYTAG